MLNLDAFDLAQLQNFTHLLNLYEGSGEEEISVVRQSLIEHVRVRILAEKATSKGEKPSPNPLERFGVCPSCGEKQVANLMIENALVEICRKCRWSRHTEVGN